MSQRVEILKRKFVRRAGLPFQEVLSEASIQSVLAAEEVKYRNRLYTPIITIWMFLSQVLEPDKSLSNEIVRTGSSNLTFVAERHLSPFFSLLSGLKYLLQRINSL